MISLPEALFWIALVALPYVVLRVRRAWVLASFRRVERACQHEAARLWLMTGSYGGATYEAFRAVDACQRVIAEAESAPLWRWSP